MYLPNRFGKIDQRIQDLTQQGLTRPIHPTTEQFLEIKEESKKIGYLPGYLNTSCQLISHYRHFFQFVQQKSEAIDAILVLENEDVARRIQGELSMDHYQRQRMENAPFAYLTLLEAEGEINGFNSLEIQNLIGEGKQVCRNLGNIFALRQFAAFTIDHLIAAGKSKDALAVASRLYHHKMPIEDTFTDCIIGHRLSELYLSTGNPLAASKIAEDCFNRLPESSFHPCAPLALLSLWLQCRWVLDDGKGELPELFNEFLNASDFPYAKASIDHLNWDLTQSWILAINGNLEAAEGILDLWDQRLSSLYPCSWQQEVIVRRIALMLGMKKIDQAKKLEARAERVAQQWNDQHFTARIKFLWRYEEEFNPLGIEYRYHYKKVPCSPNGSNKHQNSTIFAGQQSKNLKSVLLRTQGDETNDQVLEGLETGLEGLLDEEPLSDETKNEFLDTLFSISTDSSWSAAQISSLLTIGLQVHSFCEAKKLWTWAEDRSKLWSDEPTVMSVLANLAAHSIADLPPEAHPWIAQDKIETLFRRSIQLEPENAGNLWRAGEYAFFRDQMHESLYFLNQAFQLDKSTARFALSLAMAYDHWDWATESLGVLDQAIRSGQKDSSVIMAAVEKAVEFGLWNQVQTYLKKYFEVEDEPSLWAVYYGAMSCFELEQWELCQYYLLKTVHEEVPLTWHVHAIQTALFAKNYRRNNPKSVELFEKAMELLLNFPVYETPVVTANIADEGWDRLWRSVYPAILDFPKLEKTFIARLLSAGSLPPEYFDELRQRITAREKMSIFRVVLKHHLENQWETEKTRRMDQKDLQKYYAEWLVAAKDKTWAMEEAVAWQSRCHDGEVEVVDIQEDPGHYQWQGIIFQGNRGLEYENDESDPSI